jgi:predicted nucleic acid-binding protein
MPRVKVPILYLDTSVIGGYFDDEFKEATRELWRLMEAGKYRFVTSPLVGQEVAGAPEEVRHLLTSTFTQDDLLPLSLEAEELAAAYMAQKVVPAKYEDDALHVAIAVVNGIQVIVSWNFKHLVNFQREAGFNGVNLLQGYPSVRILSPLELIYDDSEEKDL